MSIPKLHQNYTTNCLLCAGGPCASKTCEKLAVSTASEAISAASDQVVFGTCYITEKTRPHSRFDPDHYSTSYYHGGNATGLCFLGQLFESTRIKREKGGWVSLPFSSGFYHWFSRPAVSVIGGLS